MGWDSFWWCVQNGYMRSGAGRGAKYDGVGVDRYIWSWVSSDQECQVEVRGACDANNYPLYDPATDTHETGERAAAGAACAGLSLRGGMALMRARASMTWASAVASPAPSYLPGAKATHPCYLLVAS